MSPCLVFYWSCTCPKNTQTECCLCSIPHLAVPCSEGLRTLGTLSGSVRSTKAQQLNIHMRGTERERGQNLPVFL